VSAPVCIIICAYDSPHQTILPIILIAYKTTLLFSGDKYLIIVDNNQILFVTCSTTRSVAEFSFSPSNGSLSVVVDRVRNTVHVPLLYCPPNEVI